MPAMLPHAVAQVGILGEERKTLVHPSELFVGTPPAEECSTVAVWNGAPLALAVPTPIVEELDSTDRCGNFPPAGEVPPASLRSLVRIALIASTDADMGESLHMGNADLQNVGIEFHIGVRKQNVPCAASECTNVTCGCVTVRSFKPPDRDYGVLRCEDFPTRISRGVIHERDGSDEHPLRRLQQRCNTAAGEFERIVVNDDNVNGSVHAPAATRGW